MQEFYLDNSNACRDFSVPELCLYEVSRTKLESALFLPQVAGAFVIQNGDTQNLTSARKV